jgi:hypothetical protein
VARKLIIVGFGVVSVGCLMRGVALVSRQAVKGVVYVDLEKQNLRPNRREQRNTGIQQPSGAG